MDMIQNKNYCKLNRFKELIWIIYQCKNFFRTHRVNYIQKISFILRIVLISCLSLDSFRLALDRGISILTQLVRINSKKCMDWYHLKLQHQQEIRVCKSMWTSIVLEQLRHRNKFGMITQLAIIKAIIIVN